MAWKINTTSLSSTKNFHQDIAFYNFDSKGGKERYKEGKGRGKEKQGVDKKWRGKKEENTYLL